MRPVPVLFHLGPLSIHTYGIGLAIAFWVGYRHLAHRLRARGYADEWLGVTFVWIIVASIFGARLVHVLANFSYYRYAPSQIFAIWNGGLTSYGGLAFAIPVGLVSAHRRCPSLRWSVALDLAAPSIILAWAIGRVLGPQFMVAGGGKPTAQWFGMYYAGQAGRRIPVPLIQGLECFAIFVILLLVERWLEDRWVTRGVIAALAMSLWGLSRFFDEYLWLTYDVGTDAVEIGSLFMFVTGLGLAGNCLKRGTAIPNTSGSEPDPLVN